MSPKVRRMGGLNFGVGELKTGRSRWQGRLARDEGHFERLEDRLLLDGALFPGRRFMVGAEPSSIISADFNGDGRADLATANWNSDNVSVLLNQGSGVVNRAPNGVIDSPASGTVVNPGQSVILAGMGTDPDGDALTYAWVVTGPGFNRTFDVEDPGSLILPNAGEYVITLTVTDARGLADPTPAQVTVTVNPLPPGPVLLGVVDAAGTKVYVYDCDGPANGISIDGDYDETDGSKYNPYDPANDLLIVGTPNGVVVVARGWVKGSAGWQKADFSALGIAVDGKLATFVDQRTGTGDISFLAAKGSVGTVVARGAVSGLAEADLALPAPAGWTVPRGAGVYSHTAGIGTLALYGAGTSLTGAVKGADLGVLVTAGNLAGSVDISGKAGAIYCGFGGRATGDITGAVKGGSIETLYASGSIAGRIESSGGIRLLYAGGALGGQISASGVIATAVAGSGMSAEVQAGGMRALMVLRGDFTGSLSVAGDVGTLSAAGGVFRGAIEAGGKIGTIVAKGAGSGPLGRSRIVSDGGIGNLFVLGDMADADVGVGVRGLAAGKTADLGFLYVGGNYARSNVLVGVWTSAMATPGRRIRLRTRGMRTRRRMCRPAWRGRRG